MSDIKRLHKEILETEDSFLHKNDYTSAERYLLECLKTAISQNDGATEILIRNELMGIYRKVGRKEEAICTVEAVLQKIDAMGVGNQVGSATTYLNSATVYKAFGEPQKSLALFEKAKVIYEKFLSPDDERLGGLYNNMALTLVDLERFAQARELNEKAIKIMERKPLEVAITLLNMATATEKELGLLEGSEIISGYLEGAKELLESYENRDGYYAFVCEKCASVFGYYGDFLYHEELSERAKRIYEGS